jgi:hypothetical protein
MYIFTKGLYFRNLSMTDTTNSEAHERLIFALLLFGSRRQEAKTKTTK